MKKILIAAFAVLATVSCSRTVLDPEETQIEEVSPKTVHLTITAGNPTEPSTRTEMTMEGTTPVPLWSVGDALGVSSLTPDSDDPDYYDIYELSSTLNEARTDATFSGDVDYYGNQYYYAYYPCPEFGGEIGEDYLEWRTRGDYESYYVQREKYGTWAISYWQSEGVKRWGVGEWQEDTGEYESYIDGAAIYVQQFQHPTSSSFDGSSDVLVSVPFSVSEGSNNQAVVPDLQFARMVSVVKLVLKPGNTPFAGEKPEWVEMNYYDNEAECPGSLTGPAVLEFPKFIGPQDSEELTSPVLHPWSAPDMDRYLPVVAHLDQYSEAGYSISDDNAIYLLVFPQVLKKGGELRIIAIGSENYHAIERTIVLSRDIVLNPGEITTLGVRLDSNDGSVDTSPINHPVSIQLSGAPANLEQYDNLSVQATFTGADPNNPAEIEEGMVRWTLNRGEDVLYDSQSDFNGEFDTDEYEGISCFTRSSYEAGDNLTLSVSYGSLSASCSFKVWEAADLPVALQNWSGPSKDYVGYNSPTRFWFDDYRNSNNQLKTYKASLLTVLPQYAFAGAFKNSDQSGSFDAFQYFIGITSVSKLAFADCTYLTGITLPDSITSVGDNAFGYCISLASINLPAGLQNIGENAFDQCSNLESIVIPSSVSKIGDNAFGSTGVSSVTFSDGIQLTTLPLNVFRETPNLKSIVLPSSLESIGEFAFYGGALESVTIPDGVTTIARYAFNDTQLTTVTIPASVTEIGEYAFCGSPLLSVFLLPETPPTVANQAFQPYANNFYKFPIYVPDASYDAYISAAANWIEAYENPIDTGRIKRLSEAPTD